MADRLIMSSIFLLLACCSIQYVICDICYDAKPNFTQVGQYFGYDCEEYDVVTEDGYILKLFRIKGYKCYPVLLGHGLGATAECFSIRGENSLAITLAGKGHDVWGLNVRGTEYGRGHVSLNPDTDKKFWNYSFHEMGVKDLPAIIDFVLSKTNQTQLIYIGHSQGTQMAFVLLSMMPEYNAKIKACIALAPIGYFYNLKSPAMALPIGWQGVKLGLIATGTVEVFANGILRKICSKESSYELCARGLLFTYSGSDPPEFEPEFSAILFKYFPTTTSRKNLDHLFQLYCNKKFSQYDYGLKNFLVYGKIQPPDYPVEKITAQVLLLVGVNDKLSVPRDVKRLEARLPNAIYHEIKREAMNHLDFIVGKTMEDYLYPYLFEALQNYTYV